jgi:hypothetical protein
MTSSAPSKPDLPKPQEIQETVTEDESLVKKRARKRQAGQGKQANIFAGIQNALKKRLGE